MSIESLSPNETNEDNVWSQLGADSEKSRKEFAAKAGLPEDATWEQINHASLGGLDDKFGDSSTHE